MNDVMRVGNSHRKRVDKCKKIMKERFDLDISDPTASDIVSQISEDSKVLILSKKFKKKRKGYDVFEKDFFEKDFFDENTLKF